MATLLAYVEPVPGRLYPLIPELMRRGRRVAVRTGAAEVELLHPIRTDAAPPAPGLVVFARADWQPRPRFGALTRAPDGFGQPARPQVADRQPGRIVANPSTAARAHRGTGCRCRRARTARCHPATREPAFNEPGLSRVPEGRAP